MTTAQELRNNPNIEIQSAAEEICIYERQCFKTTPSQTTYVFQDGSVLVCNPFEVLFNN